MARLLLDFIRSPVTAVLVTFVLAALASLKGRWGVRAQKIFLLVAAVIAWVWIVFSPQIVSYSWSVWLIFAVGSALILGFVSYYVGQALEPLLPDLFLFRDSPLLTAGRKKLITTTVTSFREYLSPLGFEFSTKKVSVGIGKGLTTYSPLDRLGRNSISFKAEQVDDPRQITHCYARYLIGRMLYRPDAQASTAQELTRIMISEDLSTYSCWSFWDGKDGYSGKWLEVFWDIRQKFGKGFADELLACVARSFVEEPSPIGPTHDVQPEPIDISGEMNQILFFHLQTAAQETDNELEKWPEILSIFRSRGLGIDPN